MISPKEARHASCAGFLDEKFINNTNTLQRSAHRIVKDKCVGVVFQCSGDPESPLLVVRQPQVHSAVLGSSSGNVTYRVAAVVCVRVFALLRMGVEWRTRYSETAAPHAAVHASA